MPSGGLQLNVKIEGVRELVHDLGATNTSSAEFRAAMRRATKVVDAQVQRHLRGGNPLHVRTGRLSQSVTTRVVLGATGYEGIVGPQRVKYARIHELGGTITPTGSKYLRFRTRDGRWHTVRKVIMPKRPYLAPSAKETAPQVAQILASGYTQRLRRRR